MTEKIELTSQEIEEIKDTAKFRECVMLKLKRLTTIPDRVRTVETKVIMLMWGIPIVTTVLCAAFWVWAK